MSARDKISCLVLQGCLFAAVQAQGVPPACTVPVSTNPPAVLTTNRPPQMMLLTFDDAVHQTAYDLEQLVLTNHWNPNGDPIQATFFVSLRVTDNIDYWLVQRLHAAGHEIALHTMTHTNGAVTDLTAWRRELEGCRHTLSRLAAIPRAELVGFRAPYLAYATNSFLALYEHGFWYDASVFEKLDSNSHVTSAMIWPYTLHDGLQQAPWTGTPPDRPLPGLFEVPMWYLINSNESVQANMDPSGTYEELTALFQECFEAHYQGNRAPMGIFLHPTWLQAGNNVRALNDFIEWTLDRTGVWWVSGADVVQYMRSPVSADSATGFSPFASHTYTPMPSSETTVCKFSPGTVRVCGPWPPDCPVPTNAFCTAQTGAVGEVTFMLTGSWSTGCQGEITVTNNGTEPIVGWTFYFELSGATHMANLWNAAYKVEAPGFAVNPGNFLRVIDTGSSWKVGFVAGGTSPFAFTNTRCELYRRQGPEGCVETMECMAANPPAFRVSWDDTACGYGLESAGDLAQTEWETGIVFYGDTSWTYLPTNASERAFYRLNLLY